MEKSAYQTLVDFWTISKFDIKFGPTPLAGISKLEDKYAIKLPPSFREYLLYACPVGVDQHDPDLTTWWELERVKSLQEESQGHLGYRIKDLEIQTNAASYLVFADYMIWSWAWAICCAPGENYGRILQLYKTEEFVSNSFDGFVQSYIKLWDKGFFLDKIE